MDDKRITLRIPADVHVRLVEQAARDRRSLNAEIVYLLETAIGGAGGDADPPRGRSAFPAPLHGGPDSSLA
ncbi:toxin-antitoxin system HicB family antitoxin [Actinomadura sp. CNU-125]|uniref:toxin-antitoxin system HicB family antitoxin n=1 Tax=Actinomadura sp. CNU-125 TaxID=1904961 RepID=UPI001177A00B|nr:toxin-antitoxin system HicB family antitoxin [Actinomadura sp. CNU-125]